ncbi:hypothetical protein Taro_001843 [Colocasia esculenta]|uniref:Uncharacterized protein n=1 Tax=Colocasia esculenta TaxID=4460 RepID=A0A843TB49_COLES|nr:hypothetical protein [Colocasia esculenta]
MARNQWQAMQDTVAGLTQALQNVVQARNQAAAARNGADDLHRNFRSLNSPRFSGSPDLDEAENWQEEMERIFQGHLEELLVAEELWNDHKKPFFFPFSSAATCTNHPLEVDQSLLIPYLLPNLGDYEVQEEEQVEDGNASE